jgi:hypothetical protein
MYDVYKLTNEFCCAVCSGTAVLTNRSYNIRHSGAWVPYIHVFYFCPKCENEFTTEATTEVSNKNQLAVCSI